MASRYVHFLCNSIKTSVSLNQKLSFYTLKSNYHVLSNSFRHNLRNGKAFYATAAYKEALVEDTVFLNNAVEEKSNSLDSKLSNIDWIAKRSGRILLKHVEAAFNLFKEKNITTAHGLHLLRCCKYVISEPPHKRIELANQIWNRFQELGIAVDVRHYNALLDVHIKNNSTFNPTDILDSMEEQNIEPDKMTCLLLISKYCKDGNLSGANEILHFMNEKGFSANEEVFNHLIEGHLKNNDLEGAKDLLEVMKSSNLNPTEDTNAVFASFYALNGNIEKMMYYLNVGEKIPHRTLFPQNSKMKVIEALAVSGNHQSFESVLNLINVEESRQECINLAIELIHKGFIDAAYKLIISTTSSQSNQGTNIFIKQLIKIKRPVSEIVKFCNDILSKNINDLILLNAAKAAVEYRNFDYATSLFKERLAQGYPVRGSHFLPVISVLKETGTLQEIWTLLETMYKLGIPADFALYLDYIFPAFGVPNPNDIIINVKKTGQIVETAKDALFVYYCNLGEIHHAYVLIQTESIDISQKLKFKMFLNRYKDLQSNLKDQYLKVLKFILENIKLLGQERNSEIIKGTYLAELILSNPHVFEALLNNEDILFSENVLNVCEKLLMENNPGSISIFRKLRSKKQGIIGKDIKITVKDEDEYLHYLQNQTVLYKTFLTERIFYHIKIKNIDRVSELLSLYEKKHFAYTPLMLAELIAMSSSAADVKKAKEYFVQLKHDFPSFKVDIVKMFDYATLLTKYTEYDETLNVLKDYETGPYLFVNKDFAVKSIRRFTAIACDTQNVEFVKNIKNLLISLSEFLGLKEIYLEPLINVHLNRGDLLSAVNEYRYCIMHHRIPAGLNDILKKCINKGDKRALQDVTDMTINYAGKDIALIELAVACIESGHNTEASRVIQNLSREANRDVFEEILLRLNKRNKLLELEQFINATNMHDLDIKKIYFQLLKICAYQNDHNKAMHIFKMISKRGIEPSSEFVDNLINLLKKNNQPIPLAILSKSTPDLDESASSTLVKPIENLMKYLEEENVEMAIHELNALKKGYIKSLSSKSLSDLVHLCLEKNCIKDLSSNVHAMSYIIENASDVIKPILIKYSAAGDVEKLISIANLFPDFSLKHIGFNKFFSEAFISSGKQENLLSELEERCTKKNKLFSYAAFEELLNFPQFEERVLKLAIKYLDLNFETPIAVVWAHYFMKENYDKANEIYKICNPNSFPIDKVDKNILRLIRQDENVTLGEKYIKFVNQLNARQRVKERSYGALLDVLVLKEMHKEAVDLVLESEKMQLLLQNHYRSTLITLKSALERENKPVPFSILPETFLPDLNSNSE